MRCSVASPTPAVNLLSLEQISLRGHRRILDGWGVGRQFHDRAKAVRPEQLATIIYTSGTTGPPKGAMNTHGNVVFNSQAYRQLCRLGPDDVVLGVAPLFHITGLIAGVTTSLLLGAPLVLAYRFEPSMMLQTIRDERATFTVGSITVFIALMNAPDAGGYKVWPREVEDVLYQHEAVREAAVVGVPDAYRGETVKAYVSLRPGQTATAEELIAFCRQQMAAYKYPRQVDFLDELPKTVSGKLLRRELRDRG